MIKIEFNHIHVNNPEGEFRCERLGEFFINNPQYGLLIRRSECFPSLSAINELLARGKSDAGMSGVYEWKPIRLNENEYDEVKADIESKLSKKFLNDFTDDGTIKNWFKLAMKNSVKR